MENDKIITYTIENIDEELLEKLQRVTTMDKINKRDAY